MVLLESRCLPLLKPMPDFSLEDINGELVSAYKSTGTKGLLIAFTCNHCPYALAIWPRLIELAKKSQTAGVNTIAVNPNDHPDYPEDSVDAMKEKARKWDLSFPYLADKSQEVARLYEATCTPDLYLLDSHHRLVYHGRLDDNWKDPSNVQLRDLEIAIDNLIYNRPNTAPQFPSIGCSIKWQESV